MAAPAADNKVLQKMTDVSGLLISSLNNQKLQTRMHNGCFRLGCFCKVYPDGRIFLVAFCSLAPRTTHHAVFSALEVPSPHSAAM